MRRRLHFEKVLEARARLRLRNRGGKEQNIPAGKARKAWEYTEKNKESGAKTEKRKTICRKNFLQLKLLFSWCIVIWSFYGPDNQGKYEKNMQSAPPEPADKKENLR